MTSPEVSGDANTRVFRIQPVAAPVREQVIANLREAIVDLRFRPGERLRERDLIEMTGASRTSVREAVNHLMNEGLVTAIPNRGIFVASPTAQEVAELYEVREFLEGAAAESFARQATPDDVAKLRDSLARFAAAGTSGKAESGDLRRLKDEFYEILGSYNSTVYGILSQLHARIAMLRSLTLGDSARIGNTVRELETLVDAIAAGNEKAAGKAARSHVAAAAAAARRLLSQRQELGNDASDDNLAAASTT